MEDKVILNLKGSGLRITPIRKSLISFFIKAASPLSVSDILSEIKANKTTIYREIEVLLKSDQLIEIDFADGKKRYELSELAHHHHLICLKCHLVQDVILEESLKKEENQIKSSKNFKVMKHNLEFFGYCQKCL
jgi:Fur family transcriptional regulator, ferric uptake regulator